MKLLKSLAVGSAALACASLAHAADIELRITGATAFRQSATAAIVQSLNNCKVGYAGATLGTSGKQVFVGTVKAGAGVPASIVGKSAIIKTSWNGSAGGVQAVAQSDVLVPISYLNASTATGGDVSVTIAGVPQIATYTDSDGGVVGNPNQTLAANEQADVTFSDVSQASTIFAAGVNTYTINANGDQVDHTYQALTEQNVGVVAFQWLRATSAMTGISGRVASFTNIQKDQGKVILGSSVLPLSFFTGLATDSAYDVYVTGRNADSGTRVTTFEETGFGAANLPVHNKASVSATNITDISVYPAEVVQGVFFDFGASGEASGGTLVDKIKLPVLASATVEGAAAGRPYTVLTYASVADVSAKSATSFALAYNGVAYSDDAIRNGQYSFWSYEVMGYLPSLGGLKKTYADFLAQEKIAKDTAEISGVKLSTMAVSRTKEGTPINPL